MQDKLTKASVIGASIDVISWEKVFRQICDWALRHESRYICLCNVHSLVLTRQDAEYGRLVNEADMATPDGEPVVWILRLLGHAGQQRINGPDLMWRFCELIDQPLLRGEVGPIQCVPNVELRHQRPASLLMTLDAPSIYLYGGSKKELSLLRTRLLECFPGLQIAGAYSPPFRPLTEAEDAAAVVAAINASGAGVVFVGLGCPKQEYWMAAHLGRIQAVMIGVGAAFGFHSCTIKRAPKWMQDSGLEWLHRLFSEPRRLWLRYLVTNTLFVCFATSQFISSIFCPTPRRGVERRGQSGTKAGIPRQ